MEAIGRLWMPLLPTPVADPAYLALVRFEQLDLGFVEVDLDIRTDNLDHFLNRDQHLLAGRSELLVRMGGEPFQVGLAPQVGGEAVRTGVAKLAQRQRPLADHQVGDLMGALVHHQPFHVADPAAVAAEHVLADAQLPQKSLPSAGAGSVPASVSASGAEAPAARVSILPRAASSLASQIFRYLRASPTAFSVSSRLSLPSSSWRSLSSNASRACS